MQPTSRPIFKAVVFAAVIAATMVFAGQASAAPRSTPLPDVLDAFGTLAAQIDAIPSGQMNKGNKNSLASQLASAQRAYERGQACTAANVLNALMSHAQALRNGKGVAAAEEVFAAAHALRLAVIASADPHERCAQPGGAETPSVEVLGSDNTHLSAHVSFGPLSTSSATGGGETWTQVQLAGLDNLVGAPGMPAIPTWQALVAVPAGASANLSVSPPALGESFFVNLYPFQEEAVDQEPPGDDEPPPPELFADPPFVKDAAAYAASTFVPPNPCAFLLLGQYRDLRIGQVECAAGQYNPVTDEFRAFDSVDFDLQFEGGDGTFITSQSLSPFEASSNTANDLVLNHSAVAQFVRPVDIAGRVCAGEELLILTHPNFRSAADDLADWKRDKGIATTVVNVGSGTAYDTADKIDDLIEKRYDLCTVRPSYILILGDAEWVPPARTDYSVHEDATTGSDWGYAIYPQSILDIFPDFAVGRMTVDTLAEAQRVVDKTINYESSPPFVSPFSDDPFYRTASLASQFQCCRMNQNGSPLGQSGKSQRSFIESAETARNTLTAAGYSVERIYTETVDNGGYCLVNTDPCPAGSIQQPYTGNTTPNRYYNGTLLPADLRAGSGFAWNGSTADIIDAFNDGTFLVLHRDHGSPSSWSHPSFSTGNFGSLHNGDLLPIVYSVNCKTAYFDRETDTGGGTESFMEQLLLLNGGGMVGGLGDVRNSPTWENSALTRGFFDATWPNLAPSFGGNTPIRRLGGILNHGKLYLLSQLGVAQTAGSIDLSDFVDEWIIWHAFGDPTLEMWTRNPYNFVLSAAFTHVQQEDKFVVFYETNGAILTALQETEDGWLPIGRAVVQNGQANMPFFVEPEEGGRIVFSASYPGAVSVVLGAQPDLVVDSITLPMPSTTTLPSPMLTPGQDLSSSGLVLTVDNLGSAVARGTVDAAGNPQGEGYNVDLVLSTDQVVPEGFATLPPGGAFAEDGLLQQGRLSRTVDVAPSVPVVYPIGPPVSSDLGGIVPTQIPSGPYYLCARIDPGDAVAESDETNNVNCIAVTVVSVPN